MRELRQSTSITLRVGPFQDEDTPKTARTDLTIAQTDIRLSKAGGDFAQSNDSGGATHDEAGWYYLTFDATDTGTAGIFTMQIHVSGALPVWEHFMVLTQDAWDGRYAADKGIDANTANKIADHVIRRGFEAACDSTDGDTKAGRSLLGAIAKNVNKVDADGSTLRIYEDDDTTELFNQTISVNAGASPIVTLDTN